MTHKRPVSLYSTTMSPSQVASESRLLPGGASSFFREPVSGFMHLIALMVSLAAGGVLVGRSLGDPLRAGATAIYALSMCGCFLASSIHHLVKGPRSLEMRLLRLDHAAIFPFIAGTYTPVCLLMLPHAMGLPLLAIVWTVAVLGVAYKLWLAPEPASLTDPPDMASTAVYLVMGWLVAPAVRTLAADSLPGSLPLAIAGGLAYSIGGIVLSKRLFDWWPGRFGHHEIWHVLVIVGAACMYGYVFANL